MLTTYSKHEKSCKLSLDATLKFLDSIAVNLSGILKSLTMEFDQNIEVDTKECLACLFSLRIMFISLNGKQLFFYNFMLYILSNEKFLPSDCFTLWS